MFRSIFFVLAIILWLAGCASTQNKQVSKMELPPTQQKSVEPETKCSGSLWEPNQAGLFAENKARNIGDIVTVVISEQASASKEANTATNRESSVSAGIPNFFGLESDVVSQMNPSNLVNADFNNDFSGSGETTREETLSATLTTQVIDVLPTNNLRIQGSKTVRVNNETQIIQLTGIVRPSDITANNLVDSKYVLNAQIDYTGDGVVSAKQEPGWLMQVMDTVWPF
ncbi:MAG TPA: flagellar basal body L-ring protein FlgH [Desulfohalobiaceae bacterium]|nr:flagellar basal body L-ring protein FlgH [Desulfohalobiaceae bacterium]